jgi:hypothetical protein
MGHSEVLLRKITDGRRQAGLYRQESETDRDARSVCRRPERAAGPSPGRPMKIKCGPMAKAEPANRYAGAQAQP